MIQTLAHITGREPKHHYHSTNESSKRNPSPNRGGQDGVLRHYLMRILKRENMSNLEEFCVKAQKTRVHPLLGQHPDKPREEEQRE